jgi:hypothetical protein
VQVISGAIQIVSDYHKTLGAAAGAIVTDADGLLNNLVKRSLRNVAYERY